MKLTNPIVNGWYADPEARKFGDRYYIFATGSEIRNNLDGFSSDDLVNWTKHVGLVAMEEFPHVHKCVWAPTMIEKAGKYYLIFASNDIHSDDEPGGLEIAVSDSPEGPYHAFIEGSLVDRFYNGAQPIDAHLFKDDDGTVYLFWGGWRHCNLAIMSEDMTALVPFEDGSLCKEITPPDYVEGPCMFKKDGKYYFMWSAGNWETGTYRVNAAFADSPFGPFESYSRVLDSGDGKLANGPGHNGYFYLPEEDLYLCVYHRHRPDISDGNARFMCLDVMRFGEDGNILPVEMTRAWEYKNGAITVEK
jgi:beta-xylosidase